MPTVFLATLGVRPESITIALDKLMLQHAYNEVGILHTATLGTAIAPAHTAIQEVLRRDYPQLPVQMHELCHPDGSPLPDITDDKAAHDYLRATVQVLHRYQTDGYRIHFMVAGGRKAMSIYAMLAAMWLFVPTHDKVLTVLTPDALIHAGQYHLPRGQQDRITIVDLPLVDMRVSDELGVDALLSQNASRRDDFIGKLTAQERVLCEAIYKNSYVSNEQLAQSLSKSERTIENQLTSIYDKMSVYLRGGEHIRNKRQALLQLLAY